jgi:hypothetical protein
MKITAFSVIKPATPQEIRNRLELYERDLKACQEDVKKRYKNGNPDWMPNAVTVNRNECKRRIAHYIPAIKELKWVLGQHYENA